MSAHDGCMGLDSVCMPRQSGQPRLSSSEMGGNEDRKSVVLLKTNMLYDAVAVPNIGLEVSLGIRLVCGELTGCMPGGAGIPLTAFGVYMAVMWRCAAGSPPVVHLVR